VVTDAWNADKILYQAAIAEQAIERFLHLAAARAKPSMEFCPAAPNQGGAGGMRNSMLDWNQICSMVS